MSAYRNFVQDFPGRCQRMLSRYFRKAETNDLEVTLLLAIAGSGLLIPYARLTESEHPSKDSSRFESAKDKTVKSLLKILRNALAHGNIFTLGSTHIESIVFLSKLNAKDPTSGYDCLVVGPVDLRDFISRWLALLAEAKIPGDVFSEELILV